MDLVLVGRGFCHLKQSMHACSAQEINLHRTLLFVSATEGQAVACSACQKSPRKKTPTRKQPTKNWNCKRRKTVPEVTAFCRVRNH